MGGKIAIECGGSYAPCSYILCRVTNPEASEGDYDWNLHDEENTRLIDTDWDYPGIARSFGWIMASEGCNHDATDGTVDCCDCGKTASDFIREAGEFLDKCADEAKVVDDPGYFAEE